MFLSVIVECIVFPYLVLTGDSHSVVMSTTTVASDSMQVANMTAGDQPVSSVAANNKDKQPVTG